MIYLTSSTVQFDAVQTPNEIPGNELALLIVQYFEIQYIESSDVFIHSLNSPVQKIFPSKTPEGTLN